MPDKEKVIEGLRRCLHFDGTCNDCPYDGPNCQNDVLDDAIALLKEQEPVKPKTIVRRDEYPQIVHKCGKCNAVIDRYYKYCGNCGQEVKWK